MYKDNVWVYLHVPEKHFIFGHLGLRRQNVVRTSVTHSAIASCAHFFVLTTF